ncbi:MAG: DUF98 domain-containing protein [Nitrospirae bacterium]|nr:DUF98 domain-containing protein [Candidatus Manganitrophaceae bacterium]
MKNKWMNREEFRTHCRSHSVDPLLRLLLTSDGTLIQHLESLLLGPIGITVEAQREVSIDTEPAASMGVPAGEKGIERTVWLTSRAPSKASASGAEIGESVSPGKGERKIFAVSLFPLSKLKPDLSQEILLGLKPIGRILEMQRLPTRRDQLEISQLALPEVAEGFGLPRNELLWARRYRLNISDQVLGVLSEVFSPSLSSF